MRKPWQVSQLADLIASALKPAYPPREASTQK
jgi:hypothetical protein